jgi:hypothetical protein
VKEESTRRELLPDQDPTLLKELHLLTRDGHLNQDALRKLKQVNHLVGLLTPALDDILGKPDDPVMVDVGSGNAYLGFILYDLFLKGAGRGRVLNVESRAELTQRATERAGRLGFGRMAFQTAHIDAGEYPPHIHLLTALHACDTATDDAIAVALKHGADHVALVPCCQAEVAAQLKERRSQVPPELEALFAHAWHRREFGSHLTNVLRALTLEAHGYTVTVTELTGWEHSLKNELILARKVQPSNGMAQKKLDAVLKATGVQPRLNRLLA